MKFIPETATLGSLLTSSTQGWQMATQWHYFTQKGCVMRVVHLKKTNLTVSATGWFWTAPLGGCPWMGTGIEKWHYRQTSPKKVTWNWTLASNQLLKIREFYLSKDSRTELRYENVFHLRTRITGMLILINPYLSIVALGKERSRNWRKTGRPGM